MLLFSRTSVRTERPAREGLPGRACGGEALRGPAGNAIGSDPIGGVESGGVAEICEGNPFFATGETPVVPVIQGARPQGGLRFCRNYAVFCEDICRAAWV